MSKKQVRGAEATSQRHSTKRMNGAQADIGTIHNMVLTVLSEVPETRSNDRLLISEVYNRYFDIVNQAFWQVMEEYGKALPSFETITRCRRKIQETHPELRTTPVVEKGRDDRQIDFKEYANGGVIA